MQPRLWPNLRLLVVVAMLERCAEAQKTASGAPVPAILQPVEHEVPVDPASVEHEVGVGRSTGQRHEVKVGSTSTRSSRSSGCLAFASCVHATAFERIGRQSIPETERPALL